MPKLSVKNISEILLDFLEITIIGATVFLLVYLFVGQLLEVTGNSMHPTLIDKEQIVAEKISTKLKPLERGEIVIFRHPEENERLLIKRIIALPNELIRVENGLVYVNDEILTEEYLSETSPTRGNKALAEGVEYRVPVNSYVLMGDNREESSDSRSFGAVRSGLILGRALGVYYPLDSIRLIER